MLQHVALQINTFLHLSKHNALFTTVQADVKVIRAKFRPESYSDTPTMPTVGPTVAQAFKDVGDTCQKLCNDYPVTPVHAPATNARMFFQSVTNNSDLADTQKYFTSAIDISFGRDWKGQGGAQEAAKLMVKAGKSFDQKSMATKIQRDWDNMMGKVTVAAAALDKRLKETRNT